MLSLLFSGHSGKPSGHSAGTTLGFIDSVLTLVRIDGRFVPIDKHSVDTKTIRVDY